MKTKQKLYLTDLQVCQLLGVLPIILFKWILNRDDRIVCNRTQLMVVNAGVKKDFLYQKLSTSKNF
jgi:hypothetical protein